jgi:hypothetical protein
MSENDLDLGFEINSITKSSNVYPAADYRCTVESMKLEMNTAETIKNLNIRLSIVDGDKAGKKIFARHPVGTTRTDDGMKTAVGMGLDRVKELGTACGVGGSNLAPCVGQEVIVRLGITPAKGNFDEQNDVKKYLPAPKVAQVAKLAPLAPKPAGSTATIIAKKKAADELAKAQAAAAALEHGEPADGADEDSDLPF